MKISVIIPVYNEQGSINDTVSMVRALGDSEIIVSDGNGETLKVIDDKDVIKINSEKGRGVQLNTGARAAKGEVLVFLHADTKLPEDAFFEVENILKSANGGAFDLGIDSGKFIFRIIEKLSSLRSRVTRCPYGDQTIFVRRELFDIVGGFKDHPIMEDVRFMQDIKRLGFKISISKKRSITSARRWKKEGIIYTTLRNWFIISLYYFGVAPEKLKRFYR